VPREQLTEAGQSLATEILRQASSESIARTKRLLLEVHGVPLAEALDRAVEANAAARATEDCRHGIKTFLAEKRAPDWR
jgi:methylglutaconyl-CoA hydratase